MVVVGLTDVLIVALVLGGLWLAYKLVWLFWWP